MLPDALCKWSTPCTQIEVNDLYATGPPLERADIPVVIHTRRRINHQIELDKSGSRKIRSRRGGGLPLYTWSTARSISPLEFS